MAINKKLIFWKKNTFNPPTSPTDETQDVLWYSIVFFSDQITNPQYAGKIWTNGQIFDTSVSTHHTHNQSLNTTDNVTFAGVTAGASTLTGTLTSQMGRVFNPAAISKAIGNIHLRPGVGTNDWVSSITFAGQPNLATEAQAGIYVQGNGTYGTKMYFVTTNAHATGPSKVMSLDHLGNLVIPGTFNSGAITSSGLITGTGFSKTGATDAHMLLGSGGHKAISDFNASLVTSTTTSGTTNVATSNTNTYLNIVQGGSSAGSSTQIMGSDGVSVSSNTSGRVTIVGVGDFRAYGLGTNIGSVITDDMDTPVTNALFSANASSPTNSPQGQSYPMGINFYRSAAVRAQISIGHQASTGIAYRGYSGSWKNWVRIWDESNLVNGTLAELNAGTDTTGRLQTAKLLNDWLNPKLNSKFDKTGGRLTTGTGDVNIELWRGTNASWNILNSGGYLRFQSNYTTVVGAYFDALKLDYNTGNALFKGNVTAPTFIGSLTGNASTATKLQTPRTIWGQSFDGTDNVVGRIQIHQNLGTNNYSSEGQHNLQIRVTKLSDLKSLELGVLDNGSAVIQANELNVGYNPLLLNPVSGNVGIGTMNPQHKLDVNGQIGSNGKQIANITSGNYFSNQTQATYIESSDDALYASMPKGTFPIYHSGHFNINNYLSKDGGVMNNRLLVGNLNAEFLGGNSYLEVFPYTTNRDFVNGTFITTNIDYSQESGDPFYLEIKGNSYGRMNSVYTIVQGYIYGNTLINYGVTHLSYEKISGLVALNVGGNLCFWFPGQSYWEGYSINVWSAFNYSKNRVVNVTDVAKPSGTKEVNLTSNTKTSLFHTENLTNTVIPKWDGTQLVDSILRDDGTDLLVTGSRNINIYSGKIGYSPTSDIFTSGGITYANYGLSINTGKIGLSGYLGLALYTQSEERLTVLQNGNVGIGTDAPQYKLDVNGSARIDGGSVRLPATTGIGTDSPAGDYDFAVKANFSMYTPELKVQMQATDWGGYSIYYKGSFLLIGNTEFDFWSTGEKFNFNKDLYVQTKKVLHEGNINDKLELAAYAAETITNPSGTLTLKLATETVITNTLTSSNSISISLPSPTSGRVNESILIFKIGASLPTITQPSGIVYRISSPSLVINSTWTFVYEQVWNGSSWEIYCSSAKNA